MATYRQRRTTHARRSVGPLAQRTIVCLGDSLTKRVNELVNWPNYFRPLAGRYANVINAGVSGNYTIDCINRFATDVTPKRPLDVVVWIGINDDKFSVEPGNADSSVIQANLTSLYNSVKAIGARPIAVTISPWSAGAWTANRETARQAINTWIRGAPLGVTPVDLEPTLADNTVPSHPALLAQYDNGDGLHINQAGATAVAGAISAQAYGGALVTRP